MSKIKIDEKIENMNRDQMIEILRLIEIILKKELEDLIEEYYNNKEKYSKIEKEIIENKINLIRSKKKKYEKKSIKDNISIYDYNNEKMLFHKTEVNVNKMIEIIDNENEIKEIFLIEKNRKKRIQKKELFEINKDFKILIKL
jgi:hypothetical protein